MSKLSFRARALDSTKPLPIYYAREVPDLSDYQAINRTVPQMPTGMEKEEETERHLQEVILAQQTNCRHEVYIPTPEATITVHHYEHIYKKLCDRVPQYIRVPGLGLEEEVPDYDLDSEDEEWLSAQTKERPLSPIHFERMMDKLEKGSGNTVLSVREAQSLLKDEEDLVLAVYDYWLAKRLRLGRPLIPTVRHERRDGTSSNNPYLAFRKRTEKMQTRKNRKNDETAYMQMLKLKRDLTKAKSLAEYVLERESKKHQLSQVEVDIFKKRYLLEDWSGSIMSSVRPVSTRSDSSRHTSVVGDGWDSRPALIKLEGDDVQMMGRQPVLVSAGLKRKSNKKKKYYFPTGTPEPEPVVPATPEKPVKEVSRDLGLEKSDDEEPDGIFTFRRKPHVRYHKVLSLDESGWDLTNGVPLTQPSRRKRYRFCRTAFGGYRIGNARRRVGRGGRVLWDRAEMSDSEEEPLPLADDKENESSSDYKHKRCRFVSRSPSPTSNFEFQSFPLIATSDPSAHPTDPAGGMSMFEFGGFTSDSEFHEDASSFSSLPTSQFALKPSSSDVECENPLQEERMEVSGSSVPSIVPRPDGSLTALAASVRVPASAYMYVDRTSTGSAALSQSPAGPSKLPPQSLPPSTQLKPPSEPLQRQQQQQPPPPLPPPPSTTVASTPTPSTPSLSAPSLPRQSLPSAAETNRASLSVADSKRIVLSNTVKATNAKTNANASQEQPDKQQQLQEQQHKQIEQQERQRGTQQGPKSQNDLSKPATPLSTSTSSPQGDLNSKNDKKPASNGPTPASLNLLPALKGEATTPAPPEPEPPSNWLMDGPPASILQLNTQNNSSQNNCKMVSLSEAAVAITSQFLQNSVKEEGSAPVRGNEQLSSPLQVARAVPLPLNREIHLPVVQGTVPMTTSRLPTSLPPTPNSQVAPKLEGLPQMVDKRAVSAQSLVARRTSANGSNYPEIFHTARRLSETTERGLKQALAGSVMNHNSILDSATNSLVQARANPSEVT